MNGHDYTNRQSSPLGYLISLPGVGCLIGGLYSPLELPWVIFLLSLGGFFAFLSFAFQWLETSEQGDHLLVRFGPLPSFRKRVNYDGVRGVRQDRSLLIEGWGIHLGPRGWIWNLWGRDVVDLDREEGRLRIGTNDPEGLIAHFKARCDIG